MSAFLGSAIAGKRRRSAATTAAASSIDSVVCVT
jgi:hypothetical protein